MDYSTLMPMWVATVLILLASYMIFRYTRKAHDSENYDYGPSYEEALMEGEEYREKGMKWVVYVSPEEDARKMFHRYFRTKQEALQYADRFSSPHFAAIAFKI